MVNVLGFSAEYVEKMTPGERKLYWVYYERDEEEKRKKSQQSDNSGIPIGGGINTGV